MNNLQSGALFPGGSRRKDDSNRKKKTPDRRLPDETSADLNRTSFI